MRSWGLQPPHFSGEISAPGSWPLTEHKHQPHSAPALVERSYPGTQHSWETQVGKDADVHLFGTGSCLALFFNTGFLLATPHSLEPLTPGCVGGALTLGEMGPVDVCAPPEKSWGLTSEGSPGDVLAALSETGFVTSDPLPSLFPMESILHGLLLQMDDLKIKRDKIQISD